MFEKRKLKYARSKRRLDTEYCGSLHCEKTPTVYVSAYVGWVIGKPHKEPFYWCDEHCDDGLAKVQKREDEVLEQYEKWKRERPS